MKRKYNNDEKREILELCKKFTPTSIAKEKGIALSTIYLWRKHLNEGKL